MAAQGPIENAIRSSIAPGSTLTTFARRSPFVFERASSEGMLLLVGKGRWEVSLSWECLEGVASFLRGRGWVVVGSRFDVGGDPEQLDGYLKGYTVKGPAGYVARVLETAGVVELDGGRPLRLRLMPQY